MRRLRGEGGQTAAEYVGILAVIAALVVAIALAGLGGQLVSGVQRALCLLFQGGPCPVVLDDGIPCILGTDRRAIGAGVTIASVDIGGELSWEQVLLVNDSGVPTYRVTLSADGDLGAAFGAGANLEVTNGGGEHGGGARAEGEAGITAGWAGSWDFATQEEADAFVAKAERFAVDQAAAAAAGPVGGFLYRQFVAEEWDPPPMASQTVRGGLQGEVSGDLLGADAAAEGRAVVGHTQFADGSRLVYVDVSPRGQLGAGIPGFALSGGADAKGVLRLRYDANGQLTSIAVQTSIAGLAAAELSVAGEGWMKPAGGADAMSGLRGQLSRALDEARVTAAQEERVSLDVRTALDLTDPVARAAAERYAAALTRGAGDPVGLARETSAFLQVLGEKGDLTADVYRGTVNPYGLEASGALGLKFGVDLTYEDGESQHLAGWRWDGAGNAFARRTDCVLAGG